MQIILDNALIARLIEHNIDTLGELLRDICFTDNDVGCYSNFELIEGFKPITYPLTDGTLHELLGDEMIDPVAISRVSAFRNEDMGLNVFWYWDGDGILIFQSDTFTIVNRDCKCSYGWQEIDLYVEEIKHRDYIAQLRQRKAA